MDLSSMLCRSFICKIIKKRFIKHSGETTTYFEPVVSFVDKLVQCSYKSKVGGTNNVQFKGLMK